MASAIKALMGQTLVYGLGTIVPRLLNYLLLTPFYTRILSKGDFGTMTELYSYVAFLMVLLTYGMETTFFKFSETEKQPSKVYGTISWSLWVTTGIFLLGLWLFQDNLSQWIQYENQPYYVLLMGIIIGLDTVLAIPFAKLRQEQKALWFTILKILNISVNIGLNFFFLYVMREAYNENPSSFLGTWYRPDQTITYILVANLAANGITALFLLPSIFKSFQRFDFALWKRMISFSWPLLIVGLAAMVNEVADKLLLKYLLPQALHPMEQIGIYAANYKIAVLMTIFIQMFKFAAEPFFFRQSKQENAKEVYAHVMKYFVVFGLLIFLSVSLGLDWIKYFIGTQFHEGLAIVPIVLLANLFLGIYYNLSIWYKLTNQTRLGAVISVIGAMLTIVLNVILIPIWGYWASAWITFIAYGSMMILSWAYGQKYYPVHYPIGRIGLYFMVAMGIFLLYRSIEVESTIWHLSFSTSLIGSFVIFVLFIERRFDKRALE